MVCCSVSWLKHRRVYLELLVCRLRLESRHPAIHSRLRDRRNQSLLGSWSEVVGKVKQSRPDPR